MNYSKSFDQNSFSNTGVFAITKLRKGKRRLSIDMAEVWECYVRSLVQRELKEYGWKLIDSVFTVYENTFYKRKIIPDIVL